jgi:malonyl CoA-acyl carrier protein transacylase
MAAEALLFPGQGSHADGMDEPHRGNALFERGLELLGNDPFTRLDDGTRTQQPALLLCSLAAWDAAGRPPAVATSGHSLGEYAALVAGGALDFDDAVALVDERAAAMAHAAATTQGGMVAVLGGDLNAVADVAAQLGLTVANDNAPGQVVLSGRLDAVAVAEEHAREIGARTRRLEVGGAFHSPLMEPAVERLAAALARVDFRTPHTPVYSCGTAAPFVDPRRELADNLLRPVRWRETVLAMRGAGVERFVEIGPGRVLTGTIRRIAPEAVAA